MTLKIRLVFLFALKARKICTASGALSQEVPTNGHTKRTHKKQRATSIFITTLSQSSFQVDFCVCGKISIVSIFIVHKVKTPRAHIYLANFIVK